MVKACDFESHVNRDLPLERKALKALNIVRRQELTECDPKHNDFVCARFFLFNMAFFDLDEECGYLHCYYGIAHIIIGLVQTRDHGLYLQLGSAVDTSFTQRASSSRNHPSMSFP